MKNFLVEQIKITDILKLKEMINIAGMSFNSYQLEKFLSEKQNLVFIAKEDDNIIGLLYGYELTRMDVDRPQFFIYSVDIHPNYQNKGYGTQLVKCSVDYAKKHNFSESFVITEKNNIGACRVYEKAGGKYSKEDCDRVYNIDYGNKK